MAETMSGCMQHLPGVTTDGAPGSAGPVAAIEQSLRDVDAAIDAVRRDRRARRASNGAGTCRGHKARADGRIAALKRTRRELEDRLVRVRASLATAKGAANGAADRGAGS